MLAFIIIYSIILLVASANAHTAQNMSMETADYMTMMAEFIYVYTTDELMNVHNGYLNAHSHRRLTKANAKQTNADSCASLYN